MTKNYYQNKETLSKLIRQLRGRELCLIYSKASISNMPNSICKRGIVVDTEEELLKVLEDNRVFENKVNLYYSLAEYRSSEFTASSMIKYDFCIDIDKKANATDQAVLLSAEFVKEQLEQKGLPFEMRFTGRGFHFIVSDEFIRHGRSFDPYKDNNVYKWYKSLAQELYNKCSELIDLVIYDSRRVVKLPYSIAFYPEGNFICSPVGTLKDFDKQKYLYQQDIE